MKLMLNLATRSYLNRRAIYFSSLAAILVLLGLLAGNGFYCLRAHDRIAQLNDRLTELEGQARAVRGAAPPKLDEQEQKRLLADIAFANQTLKMDSVHWTALLDRLEALVPPNVGIRGIHPDFRTGSFNLTAAAVSVGDLRIFLDNLSASPDFNDVYLLQQARLDAENAESLVNFSIVVKGVF